MRHLVGTLEIKESYKQQLSHEVAAWHTEVEIKAGEYPLYVNFSAGKAYVATDHIDAVITDNYTPSLYGGVGIGGRDGSEDIGKTSKQMIGVSRYMLEENDKFKVSLDPEFEKALKIGPSQGFDFDFQSDFYQNVKKENEVALVHEEMIKDYTVNEELAEEAGFLKDEKIREAIDSGLSAGGYVRAVAIDLMVRKHSGKSLEDIDISLKEALHKSRDKSGEIRSIVARCAKEIMDENGLAVIKQKSNENEHAL